MSPWGGGPLGRLPCSTGGWSRQPPGMAPRRRRSRKPPGARRRRGGRQGRVVGRAAGDGGGGGEGAHLQGAAPQGGPGRAPSRSASRLPGSKQARRFACFEPGVWPAPMHWLAAWACSGQQTPANPAAHPRLGSAPHQRRPEPPARPPLNPPRATPRRPPAVCPPARPRLVPGRLRAAVHAGRGHRQAGGGDGAQAQARRAQRCGEGPWGGAAGWPTGWSAGQLPLTPFFGGRWVGKTAPARAAPQSRSTPPPPPLCPPLRPRPAGRLRRALVVHEEPRPRRRRRAGRVGGEERGVRGDGD